LSATDRLSPGVPADLGPRGARRRGPLLGEVECELSKVGDGITVDGQDTTTWLSYLRDREFLAGAAIGTPVSMIDTRPISMALLSFRVFTRAIPFQAHIAIR